MSTRPVTIRQRAVLVAATALGLATMVAAGTSIQSTLQAVDRPAMTQPADVSPDSSTGGGVRNSQSQVPTPASGAGKVTRTAATHDSDD